MRDYADQSAILSPQMPDSALKQISQYLSRLIVTAERRGDYGRVAVLTARKLSVAEMLAKRTGGKPVNPKGGTQCVAPS